MSRKKINIGFDIGITSVGWAIVDEDNNILHRGVRLFKEQKIVKEGDNSGPEANMNRRKMRQHRRIIRRERNRKDDFIKRVLNDYSHLFFENREQFNKSCSDFSLQKKIFLNKIINHRFDDTLNKDNDNNNHVMNLIIKGLNTKLTEIQLIIVLYYYLSHRGSSWQKKETVDKEKKILKTIKEDQNLKEFSIWYKEQKLQKKTDEEIDQQAKERWKKLSKIEYWKDYDSFKKTLEKYIKQEDYIGLKPTEMQEKYFCKHGFFRGNVEINPELTTYDWFDEIEIILKNNKDLMSEEFVIFYKDLFNRKRNFWEGPGGENSPSKYGLYREEIVKYEENGKIKLKKEIKKIGDRLWDLSIGTCSVYSDELDDDGKIIKKGEPRSIRKSTSAEIANILSQLNNLKIEDNKRSNDNENSEKLNEEEKKKIIFHCISKNKKPDIKIISKIIGSDFYCIKKYPTKINDDSNEKDNSNFEDLLNTRKLFKYFGEHFKINDFDDWWDNICENIENFNTIIKVFSWYPEPNQRETLVDVLCNKNLDKIKDLLKPEDRQKISNLKLNEKEEILLNLLEEKNPLIVKLSNKMSEKALNKFIKEEIKDGGCNITVKFKDQISENNNSKWKSKIFSKGVSKYIKYKCLDDEIISPTTKCSFRETLKVFNKILKKHIYNGEKYSLENIVLEMPTDWKLNDNEIYKKEQKKSENLKKEIKEVYKDDLDKAKINLDKIDDTTLKKIKLWHSQNCCDMYFPDKKIDLTSLITAECQIEHIIPRCLVHDNSIDNLCLVLTETNQRKKDYNLKNFLGKDAYKRAKYKWLDLVDNKKISKKKYDLLTYYDNNENQNKFGFVGKNLSDTRYACRLMNDLLNIWSKKVLENGFDLNENGKKVNILNISGQQTQFYRGKQFLDFKKNRKANHSHHAADATICAVLANHKYISKEVKNYWYQEKSGDSIEDIDSYIEKYKFYDNKFWKKDNLNERIKKDDDIQYSYKIEKKQTLPLWGDSSIRAIKIQKKKDSDKEYFKWETIKFVEIGMKSKGEAPYKKVDAKMKELIKDWGYKIDEETLTCYGISNYDIKKYIEDNLCFKDIMKEKEKVKEKRFHGDYKIWQDILSAYILGCKINEKENENTNQFRQYMEKSNIIIDFCQIENVNISDLNKLNKYLVLKRKNKFYKVKSLKHRIGADSIFPAKTKKESYFNHDSDKEKMKNNQIFTAKSGANFKEIRLYRTQDKKYEIIPIRPDLLHDDGNVDEELLSKLIDEKYKYINKEKFFIFYRGSLLINKKDVIDIEKRIIKKGSKDIIKITGWDIDSNRISYQRIYKKDSEEDIRKQRGKINKILEDFYFCNSDELGNISLESFFL